MKLNRSCEHMRFVEPYSNGILLTYLKANCGNCTYASDPIYMRVTLSICEWPYLYASDPIYMWVTISICEWPYLYASDRIYMRVTVYICEWLYLYASVRIYMRVSEWPYLYASVRIYKRVSVSICEWPYLFCWKILFFTWKFATVSSICWHHKKVYLGG